MSAVMLPTANPGAETWDRSVSAVFWSKRAFAPLPSTQWCIGGHVQIRGQFCTARNERFSSNGTSHWWRL